MPEIRVQDEQGTTHVFPDGSTPEMIAKVMGVKVHPSLAMQSRAALQNNLAINSQPTQFERDRLTAVGLAPVQRAIAKASGNPAPDMSNMEPTAEGKFVPKGTTMNALADPRNMANNVIFPGTGTAARGVGDIAQGNVAQGSHEILSGGLEAGGTLLPGALASAPVKVAAGLGVGMAASHGAERGAAALGATPAQASLAGDVGGILAGGLAARFAPELSPGILPKEAVVQKIKNAVNPAAEDVPAFTENLNKNLDTILQHAKDANIPVGKGLSGFAEATKQAGTAAKDFWYQKMLGPVANKSVSIPRQFTDVGMQEGEYGRSASLQQIDTRIGQINDTLYPKYQKAGLAGQAAIGSDQAAALRIEGARLRDILTQEVAKGVDVPPEQVAAARAKMGQLRQMGEDIQYYSDQTQRGINSIKNEPIKGETRPTSYAIQRGQIAYREKYGTPADKSLSKALQRYRATPVQSPQPTPLTPTQAPSRTPVRGGTSNFSDWRYF